MNQETRKLLQTYTQEHVLRFCDGQVSDSVRMEFEREINYIDWRELDELYKHFVSPRLTDKYELKVSTKIEDNMIEELKPDVIDGTTRSSREKLDQYEEIGRENLQRGKVGLVLLAGGQGTRLGSDNPKGMFQISSRYGMISLFQVQAQRLIVLKKQGLQIKWYIMTSDATMEKTMKYFAEQKYFGLGQDSVKFFRQRSLPSFSFEGKVLLADKCKISVSPNGNGGLFEALLDDGILSDMRACGIEYVHVYCVDNVLVKICDPRFIGYCIQKGVDAGAKVVKKLSPDESVGVICKVKNKYAVIEYSEISTNIANRRDPETGELIFNAGNICEHFFTVSFLERTFGGKSLPYHLALKKIPHVNIETGELVKPVKPNGIKLEKFIFDVFELTDKFAAWEVVREEEFSPLKNGNDSVKDNPKTATEALERDEDLVKQIISNPSFQRSDD